MMDMTLSDARQRGSDKFHTGTLCVPANDPLFVKLACAISKANEARGNVFRAEENVTLVEFLGAWTSGWTAANLLAPVPGLPDMPSLKNVAPTTDELILSVRELHRALDIHVTELAKRAYITAEQYCPCKAEELKRALALIERSGLEPMKEGEV